MLVSIVHMTNTRSDIERCFSVEERKSDFDPEEEDADYQSLTAASGRNVL